MYGTYVAVCLYMGHRMYKCGSMCIGTCIEYRKKRTARYAFTGVDIKIIHLLAVSQNFG